MVGGDQCVQAVMEGCDDSIGGIKEVGGQNMASWGAVVPSCRPEVSPEVKMM